MTPHVGGRGALAAQPGLADLARRTSQQRQAGTARGPVGEEAWIVSTVAAAIGGIVNAGTVGAPERPMRIAVENHLWAPETYAPGVAALLAGASAAEPVDHDVRSPLTDLAVDTLLEQNVRVSALLARAMRSAAAHESAAFLVGAFALRESTDLFGDARPALSRMAAHLAVAQALRGQGQETLDGSLARVILSVLVGHQRAALAALDTLAPRLVTAADRAWDRALRLRITGNWRAPLNVETATLVERLEQARALRSRVGSQALLDSLEPLAREDVTDWARIALSDRFTVSTGWRFTEDVIERELDEAARIWSRLHGGRAAPADLTAALNDRPVPSVATRRNGEDEVAVLDWGLWAGFSQRQLGLAVTARSRFLYSLGRRDQQAQLVRDVKARFARLTLYPVMLRWVALTPEDYQLSVSLGRPMAAATPEVLTAAAWNFLATKPDWVRDAAPFPFERTWFVEAVPSGTAFDLANRSLRPGCDRPPTLQQLAVWVKAAPYDHWTQWAGVWQPVTGKPSVDSVRRAFAPVLAYDLGALRKMVDYLPMGAGDRIAVARQMCDIATHECEVLAEHLLREGKEAEAVKVLEQWMGGSPDALRVAARAMWLVRHYARTGNLARAEALARTAADVYSHEGLRVYAHFLDSQGRYDEAETVYLAMRARYDAPEMLGAFKVRQALRAGDQALELEGWDLLRSVFPRGGERLVKHALDAVPKDGVVFATFGDRAARVGLKATDVIVGLDGWRVRGHRQYVFIAELSHDEAMTFTVWRNGRYEEVRTKVPERWLGVGLDDYRGGAPGTVR
ncbi:MAG: hypothetical protein IT177_20915 [Acidobacteria bacterium]|nr:hypothetical protein [Acidobacteriota bacterium]